MVCEAVSPFKTRSDDTYAEARSGAELRREILYFSASPRALTTPFEVGSGVRFVFKLSK